MQKQKIVATVIGVVVVGGGMFYAGMKYGQSTASASRAAAFSRLSGGAGGFSGGARGTQAGGGITAGQVIAKDATSVTVQLSASAGGGSKIVFLSATTPVMKSVTGSANDIVVGDNVTISGTVNSDGSLTATNVQIRPEQPAQAKTN